MINAYPAVDAMPARPNRFQLFLIAGIISVRREEPTQSDVIVAAQTLSASA